MDGFLFLVKIRRRTRTQLNATVQWTVARHRLDRDDTLLKSSPVVFTKPLKKLDSMTLLQNAYTLTKVKSTGIFCGGSSVVLQKCLLR
jgi:hypothetical protein